MQIPDIFNNILPYLQNLHGGGQNGRPTYTPSGQIYNGPFKNDNRTPFRTIRDTPDGRGAGAYGQGLNASAAQLYDHFRQDGGWAVKAGLPRAGMTQSIEDFLNRGNPVPADVNPGNRTPYGGGHAPPPKSPTAGFGNNFNGSIFNGGMAPSMPNAVDQGLGMQQMNYGNPMGGMNNWFSNFTAPRPMPAPAPMMPMKGMFGVSGRR